jgi:hypothetical protein
LAVVIKAWLRWVVFSSKSSISSEQRSLSTSKAVIADLYSFRPLLLFWIELFFEMFKNG